MSHEDKILAYQEILSAYRNGDEELYPEAFAEAFAALEEYPELAEWFEQDQAFDDEFRSALNDFETPEFKTVEEAPEKVTRISFLKMAASLLLGLALASLIFVRYDHAQDQKSAALVADLRESMAVFAASSFELDAMNNDLSALRALITKSGGLNGDALDQVFANGTPMGCKVIDWDGRTVSLYCFGNSEGQVVHAFVVPVEELNGRRALEHLLAIEEFSDRDTGGFISGDSAYLLVSSMPGVDIKPFLLPAQQAQLSLNTARNNLPVATLVALK